MKIDPSASFKQSTLLPFVELRIAVGSGACYAAHSHDEFSFGLINAGKAKYHNHGVLNRIQEGDVVTINPSDVHSCNPEHGAWSYQMLFVDTNAMGEVQRDVLTTHKVRSLHDYTAFERPIAQNPTQKAALCALLDALNKGEDSLQAQAQLYEFVEEIFVDLTRIRERAKSAHLEQVKQVLLDEIDTPHSLDELAQQSDMSRYQLLRAFKKQYGLPPHAYLLDEKIKRAKVRLKRGESIATIAHALGFADQAHFQRQFKKLCAVTPKYYQSHFVG